MVTSNAFVDLFFKLLDNSFSFYLSIVV